MPVNSAIPDFPRALTAGIDLAHGDGNSEKNKDTIKREVAKPFFYAVLPFGGGQLKKAYEGISAVLKGGSYSMDSEGRDILQYPVFQGSTPLQKAGTLGTAALFGKTSLPTGQDWVSSGFQSSTAAETAVYQALTGIGTERQVAYDSVKAVQGVPDGEGKTQRQNNLLMHMELTPEEKAVTYYGLLASVEERELMVQLENAGADPGGVYAALSGIKAADSLKNDEKSNAKREAILNSGLTEEEKLAVYRAKISDERYADINTVLNSGLGFDDWLKAQSEYATLSEGDGTAGEKTTQFSRWLNGQGYSGEQYDALRGTLRFFSFAPTDETMYEKLRGANWPDQTAYSTYQKLSDLEPLQGKKTVSDLQKARVIVDAAPDQKTGLSALETVLSDSEYAKVSFAGEYQITPSQYVDYREKVTALDDNGSITQEEAERALDGLSLTWEQKAVLWQVQNSQWKPKKNPYSVELGTEVYLALLEEKEAAKPENQPSAMEKLRQFAQHGGGQDQQISAMDKLRQFAQQGTGQEKQVSAMEKLRQFARQGT